LRQIIVEQLQHTLVEDQLVELVERKGKGHPDSICDAIANNASLALCDAYKNHFGRILHHNLDKLLLVAGRSSPQLGGGSIAEPMRIVFGDRCTASLAGKHIDVESIVFGAARDWLRENLRFVAPEAHVIFQNEIKMASGQLVSLFERPYVGANDTSAATGFAPFTSTERAVLSLEKYLNSAAFKELFPETGEDVKVMAFRHQRKLHLTIAIAFISRFVPDRETYFKRKSEIAENVRAHLRPLQSEFEAIQIDINTLDDPHSYDAMYLTVLGTSAEGSDSGEVGRGNRANGIISLSRPQSIEAHAGKNPVNHVGKIYSYFAAHVARQVYSQVPGLREVYVELCSQIGRPIDDPLASSLKLVPAKGASFEQISHDAQSIFEQELCQLPQFTSQLATRAFYATWEDTLL